MKEIKVILNIAVILFLWSCKNSNEEHTEHEKDIFYTCPMHPSVQNNSPGACPVCNMSLIKVEIKQKSNEGYKGNIITLDTRQQLLAGIETDTVKFKTIIPTSTILGTVSIDEKQVTSISSRVKGRIDKLFVRSSGEFVQKGNSIYGIYSEELVADEKEYLALLEQKKQVNSSNETLNNILSASKNKLLLWGLTNNQILELEVNKKPSLLITFFAPTEGYVTELLIKEGVYVEDGTPLMKLAGLKQVWVEAQVYTNEKMSSNNLFHIFSESSPNEIYNGRLVFNNPSVESGRKIQLLRITVDNAKHKLIPGMMVYVSPKKTTQPVLLVPKSAVLLEKMKTVWIKTDETTFEQRMIETGTENNYFVEILSGLKLGDIVVTSGAYLISSEFILKSGAGQRHDH